LISEKGKKRKENMLQVVYMVHCGSMFQMKKKKLKRRRKDDNKIIR
jgi:Zn ribbon nucleic-acid-binding protein